MTTRFFRLMSPLILLLATAFTYLSTATLVMLLQSLKSHRVDALYTGIGQAFFYRSLYRYYATAEEGHFLESLRLSSIIFQSAAAIETAYIASTHLDISRLVIVNPLGLALLFKLIIYIITGTALYILPLLLTRFESLPFLRLLAFIASIGALALAPIILPITYFLHAPKDPEDDATQSEYAHRQVREQLLALIHDAESKWKIDDQNKMLLAGFLKMQERVCREIMIPRVEIFALSQDTTIRSAAQSLLEKGYTRVPIFNENIDNITGILFAKDLLALYIAGTAEPELSSSFSDETVFSYTKPAMFIPSTKSVSSLLKDFRKKRTHIALIVDEYGGTEGLVTIEDILEELVGEITDEYDAESDEFEEISPGEYRIDAHMSILDLNDKLDLNITPHPEYDSISGFIFYKLGSIPQPGQIIHQETFDLKVLECSDRSVERVEILLRDISESAKELDTL